MKKLSFWDLVERAAATTPTNRHPSGYAIAIVGNTFITLLVGLFFRSISPQTHFLAMMPVLIAASFLGGVGPGLVATVFGALSGLILIPGNISRALLFLPIGLFVALGGEWALRGRERGRKAATALEEREAHLRSIFDAAPDAIIVIDDRGIIQSYSASAERMFGWTASQAIGKNVSLLMPGPYKREHDSYMERYRVTGQKRIIGIGRIVVGERKDGSTFPLELAVGEIKSHGGRPHFTGFVRDLTERQQTEARLQELQSEIIHISRLSAMGEMASALAHELNQPLSAIANYLSGARRLLEQSGKTQDPRALEAISRAVEQALRAGEIIRRLRDFLSRGEGERSVESLPRLVQEACTLALVGGKEYGVRVHYLLDPKIDLVMADRVQIQQVILNLVRNALDAMQDWEGAREITVSSEFADDDMASIKVTDTGPGLDSAVASKLFQPFVTTKSQGMGVGLSISRTIIEAHGGRIWTEPNPAGGTVFGFTLRLAHVAASEEAQ